MSNKDKKGERFAPLFCFKSVFIYSMKKLILLFALLLLCFGLCAQNSAYNKTIYRDFGTFKVVSGNNVVSVSAFATIEKVDPATHVDEGVEYKELKQQKLQKEIVIPKTLYHYELYLVSKSVYQGDTTSTWLYGTRIFINGEDMLESQFPDGFVIAIKTEPTSVYTYHSTKPDVNFEIKWEKAIYEPRIRK